MSFFTKIRDVAATGAGIWAATIVPAAAPALAAALPKSVTSTGNSAPSPAEVLPSPPATPAGQLQAAARGVMGQPYFVPALLAVGGLLAVWVVVRVTK